MKDYLYQINEKKLNTFPERLITVFGAVNLKMIVARHTSEAKSKENGYLKKDNLNEHNVT